MRMPVFREDKQTMCLFVPPSCPASYLLTGRLICSLVAPIRSGRRKPCPTPSPNNYNKKLIISPNSTISPRPCFSSMPPSYATPSYPDPLPQDVPSDVYETMLAIRKEQEKGPALTVQQAFERAKKSGKKGAVGLKRGEEIAGGGGAAVPSVNDADMGSHEDGLAGEDGDAEGGDDGDEEKEEVHLLEGDASALKSGYQRPFLLQNGKATPLGEKQIFYRGGHVRPGGDFPAGQGLKYMQDLLKALPGRIAEVVVPGLREPRKVLVLMCGEMLGRLDTWSWMCGGVCVILGPSSQTRRQGHVVLQLGPRPLDFSSRTRRMYVGSFPPPAQDDICCHVGRGTKSNNKHPSNPHYVFPGMSLDGIPYALSETERTEFEKILKGVDLVVCHQHNRFPYPAMDRHRITRGWGKFGGVFANANNRQKSSTVPGTISNPAAKGLSKDELYDEKKAKTVGSRVVVVDASSTKTSDLNPVSGAASSSSASSSSAKPKKSKVYRILKKKTTKIVIGMKENGRPKKKTSTVYELVAEDDKKKNKTIIEKDSHEISAYGVRQNIYDHTKKRCWAGLNVVQHRVFVPSGANGSGKDKRWAMFFLLRSGRSVLVNCA